MPDAMLHCEFEMLAASELRTHQEKLWQTQWAQVSALSEFYRAKAGPGGS
jgi:hypothetical protein